jgi:hypothetical protein
MVTRRRFLQGLAGATVALPFLESVQFLGGPKARAAVVAGPPRYAVFVRQGNGCAQQTDSEPERFWPRALGAITTESLSTTDSDRAVAVLAPYADRLLLVRGTRYNFPGAGCGHSGGINQCLTAARVIGEGADSLANGPSIDWFISQQVNPVGVEPLTLMSGPQNAYIAFGLSYSGSGALRGAQNNPFTVYQNMMGLSGASQELLERIALRRTSVNDLVRAEMQDLIAKPYLSATDKSRLQMHFDAIRDIEVGMGCTLTDSEVQAMQTISSAVEDNGKRIEVAHMMMDLIALAFACDANRVATLQIGTGNDSTRYMIDGVLQNTFHRISHRIDSDGSEGTPIPNADLLHHGVDKIFAGMFKHLLDRLAELTGPSGGSLLDDSVALWTNDLATGPGHSYSDIPQVLAGRAGGFLRTGQYLDAGDVAHNKLLNTIASAVGIRNDDGSNYDQFGDSSLPRGVIPAMIA